MPLFVHNIQCFINPIHTDIHAYTHMIQKLQMLSPSEFVPVNFSIFFFPIHEFIVRNFECFFPPIESIVRKVYRRNWSETKTTPSISKAIIHFQVFRLIYFAWSFCRSFSQIQHLKSRFSNEPNKWVFKCLLMKMKRKMWKMRNI